MVFVKRRVDATRHSRSGGRQFEEPELNLRSIIVLGLLGWLFVSVGCATPSLENRRSATLDSNREAIEAAGPPRRVVLITVGGLDSSDFLNSWGHVVNATDRVRMPTLARLAREGAIGVEAHPPTPGSVYASHATLATGRLPAQHGVVSDFALDREGKRALPFWDSRLLKGTALWDAAIGRGVLALGWPTTMGARIELVVPDGEPTNGDKSWLEFIRNRTSPSLLRELEAIAGEAIAARPSNPVEGGIAAWPTSQERDAAYVELACGIVASERDPGLWMIRLNQTASYQHSAGFGSVEVDAALGRVDLEIGRLIACLESAGQLADTAIFVTGDVSYRAVHTQIDPNVTLVRHGLIGRDPRATLGVRSWLALVRTNGRSAYVYARDAASAVEARKVLEEEAARTNAFEVVSAADLAESGADPQAWFGLAANPGFVIGNGLSEPVLRPAARRGSAGAFPFRDPEASSVGFVAWGRGIRSQVRVPSLDLSDVAPTIAILLGLRLDDRLDGEAIVGILRAAAVSKPPPGPKRLGVGSDGDVDRALRELGGGRPLGRDE